MTDALSTTAMTLTPPDLIVLPGFLRQPDRLLRALMNGVDWDTSIRSRRTACYGKAYEGSGVQYADRTMHPVLVPVVDQIAASAGWVPNNCLLNLYSDGDSTMGFHSDVTSNLAEHTGIVIISLGSARDLVFRSKSDHSVRQRFSLRAGDLLEMSAAVQDHWMHAIPACPGAGLRISLTFRQILAQ